MGNAMQRMKYQPPVAIWYQRPDSAMRNITEHVNLAHPYQFNLQYLTSLQCLHCRTGLLVLGQAGQVQGVSHIQIGHQQGRLGHQWLLTNLGKG
jgi:hypothetical protein